MSCSPCDPCNNCNRCCRRRKKKPRPPTPCPGANVSMQATAHVFFTPEPTAFINYNYERVERIAVGKVLLTMATPLPVDPETGFPFNVGASVSLLAGPGFVNFNNAILPGIDLTRQHIVETWNAAGEPADLPFVTIIQLFDPDATPGSFGGC